MTGVVDVGDAVELTFATAAGAAVTVSWLDPDQILVIDNEVVDENIGAPGLFTATFLPTRAGVWTARFTASGAATAVESYYIRATPVTGPAPLASVGDVASQYGTMTPAQEALTGWLLRAASKLIRSRFPLIDAQLAAGILDHDVIALGITNMILRVLRNPGGLRAETVGPFSRTYDTGNAAGLLIITEQEESMFTPVVGRTVLTALGTAIMRPGLAPPPRGLQRGW